MSFPEKIPSTNYDTPENPSSSFAESDFKFENSSNRKEENSKTIVYSYSLHVYEQLDTGLYAQPV